MLERVSATARSLLPVFGQLSPSSTQGNGKARQSGRSDDAAGSFLGLLEEMESGGAQDLDSSPIRSGIERIQPAIRNCWNPGALTAEVLLVSIKAAFGLKKRECSRAKEHQAFILAWQFRCGREFGMLSRETRYSQLHAHCTGPAVKRVCELA